MRVRMLTDTEEATPCFVAVMVSDHDDSPLFASDPLEDVESALESLYRKQEGLVLKEGRERIIEAIEEWKANLKEARLNATDADRT